MKTPQIRAALDYNDRQPYDQEDVKIIQLVVGATPDGLWGPRTVRSIALWQEEVGLDVDGKVGPETHKRILVEFESDPYETAITVPEMPRKVRRGLWVDDHISRVKKPEYADELVECGFSVAALMTNRSNTRAGDDPWDLIFHDDGMPGWADDDIAIVADNMRSRDIGIVLTSWPLPTKSQIEDMCEAMVPLLRITRAIAFEVDVEGNWMSKHLDGSLVDLELAGEYLVSCMRQAVREATPSCPDADWFPSWYDAKLPRTEATTFVNHGELRLPTVIHLVDTFCCQAYSVSKRNGKRIDPKSILGPGRHQRQGFDRAMRAGVKHYVQGNAAYRQSFKGMRPDDAMKIAYDTGVALGVDEMRDWSSKWIVGARENTYAKRFHKSLAV